MRTEAISELIQLVTFTSYLNKVNERTLGELEKRFNSKVVDITSSIPPLYQQLKEFIHWLPGMKHGDSGYNMCVWMPWLI